MYSRRFRTTLLMDVHLHDYLGQCRQKYSSDSCEYLLELKSIDIEGATCGEGRRSNGIPPVCMQTKTPRLGALSTVSGTR